MAGFFNGTSSPANPVWLFDLDNTLHNAEPAHLSPHQPAMRDYIERHLGVDSTRPTAPPGLLDRYGATLLGLMRHHGTDPDHFLRETHQFPDLAHGRLRAPAHPRPAPPARAQDHLLQRPAPLRRSHPRHHRPGACFDAVYSVETSAYQPKPMLAGFRALLRANASTRAAASWSRTASPTWSPPKNSA
jgi:putative hydrolase of the HAD superfamily